MNANSLKSYVGMVVNLHMMDGSVIINVKILGIDTKKHAVKYICKSKRTTVKMGEIDRIRPLPVFSLFCAQNV